MFDKKGFKCNICSDSTSYSEKFTFNLLKQLIKGNKIKDFVWQYTYKNNKWCDKYKYDFYFELDGEGYIIETHGMQHYKETTGKWDSLEYIINNDLNKYNLAISNEIKTENYIVIDCRYSELEFIKNNILSSRLNEIFDLSDIDWIECEKETFNSNVIKACNLWNSGVHNVLEIANILKLSNTTITKYLHKCSNVGLCKDYDAKNILKERSRKNGLSNGKKIEIFKEGKSLGVLPSTTELSRISEKIFGVKLIQSRISSVAKGDRKHHKGFTFKYV